MKRVVLMTLLLLGSAKAGPPQYDVIPPGGLWGPVRGASPATLATTPDLPLSPPPRSTADMATINPAVTLILDDHDTPTAIAVAEATKSNTTNASDHHHPATQQPSNRATAKTPQPSNPATTTYTCPMHPEVTSDKPGTCPKCGMTLVKKAPKK